MIQRSLCTEGIILFMMWISGFAIGYVNGRYAEIRSRHEIEERQPHG